MIKMSAPEQPALPQTPAAPPPPPVFAQSPQGQKPGKKPSTPSFLNSSALPSAPPPASGGTGSGGGKQLVGQ